MGGRGSGGQRTGSGRKKLSALERAIGGQTRGPRRGVVLQHPTATPTTTAVAPVEIFGPPAALAESPAQLAAAIADLQFLKGAAGPGDPNPQIDELETRVEQLTVTVAALTVWQELAPHAFAARTLTPGTAAAFVMLCRGVVAERALSASQRTTAGPNHRGIMQRVAAWMKDFNIAPFGKPMYESDASKTKNPLDRFTKARA